MFCRNYGLWRSIQFSGPMEDFTESFANRPLDRAVATQKKDEILKKLCDILGFVYGAEGEPALLLNSLFQAESKQSIFCISRLTIDMRKTCDECSYSQRPKTFIPIYHMEINALEADGFKIQEKNILRHFHSHCSVCRKPLWEFAPLLIAVEFGYSVPIQEFVRLPSYLTLFERNRYELVFVQTSTEPTGVHFVAHILADGEIIFYDDTNLNQAATSNEWPLNGFKNPCLAFYEFAPKKILCKL